MRKKSTLYALITLIAMLFVLNLQVTQKINNLKQPVACLSDNLSCKVFISDYDALLDKYGLEYGVDKQILHKIANCESSFNPEAINGPYGGLYQFSSTTWVATRDRMGEPSGPEARFNAEEAIKTAAFKIAEDGTGAWPVCG